MSCKGYGKGGFGKRKIADMNSDTSQGVEQKRARQSEDQKCPANIPSELWSRMSQTTRTAVLEAVTNAEAMPSALLWLEPHLICHILFLAAPRVLCLTKCVREVIKCQPSNMSDSELRQVLKQHHRLTRGRRPELVQRLENFIQTNQNVWSGSVSYDAALAVTNSPDFQEQKTWCRALELVFRPLARSLGHLEVSPELTLSVPDAAAFNWCHLCYRNRLTIMNEFKKESKSKTWVSVVPTACAIEKWRQWSHGYSIPTKPNCLRFNKYGNCSGVVDVCKEPLPRRGTTRWVMVLTDVMMASVGLCGNRLPSRPLARGNPTFRGLTWDNSQTPKKVSGQNLLNGRVFRQNDVLCFEANMDYRSLKIWRENVFLISLALPAQVDLYIAAEVISNPGGGYHFGNTHDKFYMYISTGV